MRAILMSLVMTILVACAQTSPQEFATVDGERIALTASITPGVLGTFRLNMNGDEVIEESFEIFGGSSQTFEGRYRGDPVSARVTQVQKWFTNYHLVDVFYKGQLIDTLQI
ncbi:MAG: hypothetical protein AAFR57_07335 [Pseudomonadota bacterium]